MVSVLPPAANSRGVWLHHSKTLVWGQSKFGLSMVSPRPNTTTRNYQDFHSPKLRGSLFVSGSIKILWDHLHKLWIKRKEDTHGSNPETQEVAAYAQAQREVEALYDMRHLVQPSDQSLFYSFLEQHFATDTTSISLRSWINTWRPVIHRSAHYNVAI